MFRCFSCSVDPFLFENFNTVDGDFLTAKFRAFKFPDSTYVQFRGTVNACVDKCKGIQCSNGQIGYGRRKREIAQSAELNNVYEISMTAFICVVGDPINKGNLFAIFGQIIRIIQLCTIFDLRICFFGPNHTETAKELESKLEQLKMANQKLQRNSRGSVFQSVHDNESALIRRSSYGDSDEPIHIRGSYKNAVSKSCPLQMIAISSLVFTVFQLTQRRY